MRLVVDCNSLAYRVVYNMSEMTHGKTKTGVIFGFLSQLRNLAEKFDANQFVFCWDSRQSYRKLIDPEYKNRVKPEKDKKLLEEAYVQFDLLRDEILLNMGFVNVFMQSGYEADDLVAWTVARHPENTMIVTGDEDLLQLLWDDRFCPIHIYDLFKKKVITEKDFRAKYGISPYQWAWVKAMGGCDGDNVKGIPGVGIDSAVKYLNKVLKDGKIKQKIESKEGLQMAKDCMELVALPFNGDRPIDIKEIVEDKLYSLDFMDAFHQYGCSSFINDFDKWRRVFKLISGRTA